VDAIDIIIGDFIITFVSLIINGRSFIGEDIDAEFVSGISGGA